MKLIPLLQPPEQIYLLPYTHDIIPLALACVANGAILRTKFMQNGDTLQLLRAECSGRWPQALLLEAPAGFAPDPARGSLYGTPFQQAVWRHLTALQAGQTVSYGQLARAIGKPAACRAVGAAVGANPYAPFVPCHRVLARNGKIGGFAGGTELKRQLLQAEGVFIAAA